MKQNKCLYVFCYVHCIILSFTLLLFIQLNNFKYLIVHLQPIFAGLKCLNSKKKHLCKFHKMDK